MNEALSKGRSTHPSNIGRYPIEGIYSHGGMSTIYLASDPVTHDPIIIKVLLPKFLSDQALVRQFINEGRIIAMANHPNIVKLYEYGDWKGGVYIAMELIQGTSLRKLLQHTPFSLKPALEILLQICHAINHLHSHGVIHGDIKPENILITDHNQVKVIDFGIARILKDLSPQSEGNEGRFIGTPVYMSPETRENPKNISVQSDIYSLGIIAYELAMGRITHGRVLLALAPRGLQPILQKALQPHPEDRFHNINELIDGLEAYVQSNALQKDRQGIDYFFELFAQLESQQKQLLTSLIPQDDPNISAVTFYRIGLDALYLRIFEHMGDTVIVSAKGSNREVIGVLNTFRLHTLFEAGLADNPSLSATKLVTRIFQAAREQGIFFSYSVLIINQSNRQFSWTQEGWGSLFIHTDDTTQEVVTNGSYQPNSRFVVVGHSPSPAVYPDNTPVPPQTILKEAINSSCHLSCSKQVHHLLQKLRLSDDYFIGNQPVCLVSVHAS